MGATSSKVEEDKALQLCRERKKFVRKALDGRCSLAATHFTYIESLTIIGSSLRRFVEPEGPMEASLYTPTATSATPEPHGKSLSRFSFSSSMSHVGATANRSPSPSHSPSPIPSPPTSTRYHANHMKIKGSFSRKVEEKPSVPVIVSVTSSSSMNEPQSPFDMPPETPWDFFGLSHPIDNDFSSQPNQNERIPEMEEDKGEKSPKSEDGQQDSEDEFDEPSTDGLVRSFVNVNRVADNVTETTALHSISSVESPEILSNSPQLSPLKRKVSGVSNVAIPQDESTQVVKEGPESKTVPKDFVSSIRDIEHFFVKASECGREVPRMLEANKLHFRPIFPGKERGSFTSKFLKACLACGDDPSQVQEEPAQNDTKYLTWHRTTSSRASSFRHDPNANINTRENPEELATSLFDNFCMNAGSHASTLDRLYAWEKKLYDEVKANEMIRKVYDQKRKLLRELESSGESSRRIDKTRAIVKDLHWRIGVAIHRIDSISTRIEDLRDKELQPQLEELIEGLRKMWEVMYECHKSQFLIISSIQMSNTLTKMWLQSDSHREIATYLESELSTLCSSFTKWIGSQKAYVQSLNGWLHKCVPPQQSSTKKKRRQPPPFRAYGPPIYVTCGVWLDKLEALQTKQVADSIKDLAAEIDHFKPRQETSKSKSSALPFNDSLLPEDNHNASFDRLKSRLEGFLGQLSNFAGLSVEMFTELQKAIQDKKIQYARYHSNN